MKLIPLSISGKNKGKYFSRVDDDDFESLNRFKWYVSLEKKSYAARREYLNGKNRIVKMHREIMNCKAGNCILIDHVDGDGLNNQKINLRFATFSQNNMNRVIAKNKIIKSKGVSKAFKSKTFRVRIGINNKSIYVGSFKTEIEAAAAYDEAAKKLHKEFANLNI